MRVGRYCQRCRPGRPCAAPGTVLVARRKPASGPRDSAGTCGPLDRDAGRRAGRGPAPEATHVHGTFAAQPDGLGAERPRIVVAVRNTKSNPAWVRSGGTLVALATCRTGTQDRDDHPGDDLARLPAGWIGPGGDPWRFSSRKPPHTPHAGKPAYRDDCRPQQDRMELEVGQPRLGRGHHRAVRPAQHKPRMCNQPDAVDRRRRCHWNPDFLALAGHAIRARGGTSHAVQQQPETNRFGAAQLPRRLQTVSARHDRTVQCAEGTSVQLDRGHSAVHGTAKPVRRPPVGPSLGPSAECRRLADGVADGNLSIQYRSLHDAGRLHQNMLCRGHRRRFNRGSGQPARRDRLEVRTAHARHFRWDKQYADSGRGHRRGSVVRRRHGHRPPNRLLDQQQDMEQSSERRQRPFRRRIGALPQREYRPA